MPIDIYIVIPVHNRKEFTRQCLLSLERQSYQNFQTVIVNDGSTDGTQRMIRNDFHEVKILSGDGNLWWTASVNLGINYALENGADYILLLNNDTETKEDFIENLVDRASKNVVQGALWQDINSGEIIDGGTKRVKWATAGVEKLLDELPPGQRQGLQRVAYYSGRGLFIHHSVFARVGLFDEDVFPHYGADQDFTLRARRSGFVICVNYDAILYIHQEESTSQSIRKKRGIQNYVAHLFSIKGGGNLKNFLHFSFRHCPKKYLIINIIVGTVRRIFGFFIST